MNPKPQAVLFDLDGTLIDSAPDLAGAGNDMRAKRGLPPLPFEQLRPVVGMGARGMVGAALGVTPSDPGFIALRDEFLDIYEQRFLQKTHIFGEVAIMLDALESARLAWGIVTNKHERFTAPIVRGLGLESRATVVVSGDTTPHSKPHPAPLLEAANRLGVAPEACVYVGDDQRDMTAGRAAGMLTIAAGWGYLGVGEPIEAWGADILISRPSELLKILSLD